MIKKNEEKRKKTEKNHNQGIGLVMIKTVEE